MADNVPGGGTTPAQPRDTWATADAVHSPNTDSLIIIVTDESSATCTVNTVDSDSCVGRTTALVRAVVPTLIWPTQRTASSAVSIASPVGITDWPFNLTAP